MIGDQGCNCPYIHVLHYKSGVHLDVVVVQIIKMQQLSKNVNASHKRYGHHYLFVKPLLRYKDAIRHPYTKKTLVWNVEKNKTLLFYLKQSLESDKINLLVLAQSVICGILWHNNVNAKV
eukprot:GHVR01036867.1.p2 GENE.GHVR01036867.1~~GHVR01036867.1.p2  ORF type:complete len:120 (-),score=1.46 GHVR01036867.1:1493-1852(-)